MQDEEEWTATVGVLEMVEGKTAKEQVRVIEEAWRDLQERQTKMGVAKRELYHIRAISFDNASNNRGVKKGIYVELDRRRKGIADEQGKKCHTLIEKGCSDHIAALCMKEWERTVAKKAKSWGLMKLLPPADTRHYLNRFTSTMKRLAKRFVDGSWKGHWPAFVRVLGATPTTPDRVTRTRFISTDQMARFAYQW